MYAKLSTAFSFFNSSAFYFFIQTSMDLSLHWRRGILPEVLKQQEFEEWREMPQKCLNRKDRVIVHEKSPYMSLEC